MKYCPKCQQQYPKTQRLCAADGELLTLPDPYQLLGRILIDKYRLDALVGIGGMGAVYGAYHLKMRRRVAVKLLLPHLLLGNENVLDLFDQEAQVAGKVSHENIATVYDAGRTPDGLAYIAMEWLEGVTLAEALAAEGRFTFARAGALLPQLCAALTAAHAAHIIHRDLKPANLMLVTQANGREQIKLLDFGIAKVSAQTVTTVSLLVGTPHYASPEQLQPGAEMDHRADLYSLGVILFQMLTGKLPFDADTLPELVRLHQHATPPALRSLRPEAPQALEDLLQQMLAKQPEERPAHARAVAVLFQQALSLNSELNSEAETLSLPAPPLVTAPSPAEPTRPDAGKKTEPLLRVTKPALPDETQDTLVSVPAHPAWRMLSLAALVWALSFAGTSVQRLLNGGPDALGILLIGALGLLCGAGVLVSAPQGRKLVERVSGFKLRFREQGNAALVLLILLVCGAVYFSLPSLAHFYNDQRAVRSRRVGDLPGAIKNYERAISLTPDYAAAHYNLASAYEDVLAFDKAQAAYQTALRLDPQFYFAYNNLGRLYLMQHHDYANALKIFNAALALHPPEPSVKYTLYKNRGWAHLGLGLYELAAEDLQEARQQQPESAAARCLLAQVLEAQQKKDAALPEWEACVAYAPGEPDVEASWLSLAQERLRQGAKK